MKLHRLAALGVTAAAAAALLGGPTSAAATSPNASGAKPVEVYAACSKPVVKPTSYVFTCGDANTRMNHVSYSHAAGLAWGSKVVAGRGRYVYNDCKPFCAAGTIHHHPVTFYLSGRKSVNGQRYYTKMQVSYAGLTETFTFPTHRV